MTFSIRDQISRAETAAQAEDIYRSALTTHTEASDGTKRKWAKAVKAKREAQESRLR